MDRILLHIDMNSYFASVEQQANPFLRGKPIGITGKRVERSVVATASIEAKRLGVKTAMSTWEAKRVCPSIILWPGDPEKYSDIMHRFNAIYRSFTPNVEPFSVDESFLDVTEEAEDYLGATCMAQAIRSRLREELGERITASIGIAPNRLMAKLACESVKPNGLTVARPQEVLDLLDASDLEDLCGIGPRIRLRLNALGIHTFQQLREFPLDDLIREFHSYGLWLHEAAHGRDPTPIPLLPKEGLGEVASLQSYGHSYTLPQNTSDPTTLKRYLFGLADKVAWRMRRDGVTARRVSAFVRFGDFSGHGEQRTFDEPVADGMRLFQIAWKILEKTLPIPKGRSTLSFDSEVWATSSLRLEESSRSKRELDGVADIRLVGLSASMLCRNPAQPSLFKKERKMASVLCALDELQHRYGSGVWLRASTLPINFLPRSSGFHFDHEI